MDFPQLNLGRRFSQLAKWASWACGRPATFIAAVLFILLWALTGPLFGFSDTWQLVVNTATTIVTFLMVFLIQNSQSRDTLALQIKLDELIRGFDGAHNTLLDLEDLDDEEIETFRKIYRRLGIQARTKVKNGQLDTDTPPADESRPPAKKRTRAR